MVRSFNVRETDVGRWAGLCSAIFSLCQALVGVPWGRFSDIYGRKPAILFGLFSTMVTSLMWGFSTNLPMAITARALAGMGNGNVGIIRTTVAEMVPFKELQPRAFSLMPLVWNVGSIFGPSIGGALANPFNVQPGERIENPNLFQRFPYALPNIVSAMFFAVGIITGILFLEETLETLHDRRDNGLRLGDKITLAVKSTFSKLLRLFGLSRTHEPSEDRETEPLLKPSNGPEEDGLPAPPKEPKQPPATMREVLTRQAFLNLIVYTLLALHTMSFDMAIPLFLQFPSIHSGSPDVTPPSEGNPLKFAGGASLDHFRIGLLSTCSGIVGMFVQFFIFPPVARRVGILRCLKICALLFPLVNFFMPLTALLPTQRWQVGVCLAIMLFKNLLGIFAYPCSTILLTNSASSLRTLGTLNGFATSSAAIGRAAGPALSGAVFTIGVKAGYVIAPFWMLTLIAMFAAIPVFWLVESDGFGGDDEVSDSEDEEEQTKTLREEALEGEAGAASGQATVPVSTQRESEVREQEEEAYGGLSELSRTNTASSAAMTVDFDSDEATSSAAQPNTSTTTSRRGSRAMRRMSLPLGMGKQGISRKFSSNLGQSFGSAGSYHGH